MTARHGLEDSIPWARAAAPKYMSCRDGDVPVEATALRGAHKSTNLLTFFQSSLTSSSEDDFEARIAVSSLLRERTWKGDRDTSALW